MRILICDDEQKLIDLELSILQEYCRSTNIAATFFTFTDSLSAGNIGEFDIAFLDIDMEKLNGIELARKLRSKNPTSIIIFVTNFIQYAPEGYEVNAFRYLLYPTAHPKDFFVEVSDEVHQFLLSMKRKEDAFARQVSRYHAYHSLDDPAFSAESYLLVPTPTPAEIIERQQHLVNINHTILALSPKQAKRCYDYFYCGISMPSIAEKEGTTVGSVSGSIKSALINLREKCNLFIKP